jgi:biotin transport system substrate-specific component
MQATIGMTVAERFGLRRSLVVDSALTIAGVVLVAVLAQVRIPLPFTPVPITGQTFGVLLVGAALGARRGGASLLLYLALGAAGLPLFAGAGAGPGYLLGPTAGYLVGFVPAAWFVGRFAERGWGRGLTSSLALFAAGQTIIYACGVGWLASRVGLPTALIQGLLPFLPLDLIKVGLAGTTLPSAWRLVDGLGRG